MGHGAWGAPENTLMGVPDPRAVMEAALPIFLLTYALISLQRFRGFQLFLPVAALHADRVADRGGDLADFDGRHCPAPRVTRRSTTKPFQVTCNPRPVPR